MPSPTPVVDENRSTLRESFLQDLLALEPESFLDVGCGGGELVSGLAERRIRALGLEPKESAFLELAPASRARAALLRADAHRLPLREGSFDWVGLRHVLHHLHDPRRALAEAWRVAGRGLLLAEPHFDTALPAQRFGLRVDDWLRRHEDQHGAVHRPAFALEALLALLPAPPSRTSTRARHLGLAWPRDEIAFQAHEALAGRTPGEAQARELDVLLEIAQRGGVTLNGSLELVVWK